MGRFGRGGILDDRLVDVPDGADGVFAEKDGVVARQVSKYLSRELGAVVDLDGRLRGAGHVKGVVVNEQMEVFCLALGFLYVCGLSSGFFQ